MSDHVLGVKINFDKTLQDVYTTFDAAVLKNSHTLISTTNAEFIMAAQNDAEFMSIINSAALSLPDGIGPILAHTYMSYLQKYRISNLPFSTLLSVVSTLYVEFIQHRSKRILGRELMYDLCAYAADKGYTVFLLGGWEKDILGKRKPHHGNIAEKAAHKLLSMYPNLRIIGSSSDYSWKESDDIKTVTYIKDCMRKADVSSLDLLFVAYNHGNQEKWIKRNADKINAKLCLGIGGSLDMISGNYIVPDKIWSYMGLEWLFRLIVQPWRAWRIFTAVIVFPITVFKQSLYKHS